MYTRFAVDILTYPFDPDRFAQATNYLLQKCGPCTHGKLCKLIYLVDRYHVVQYGRPVVGGAYNSLPYGPVPSVALDVMEDMAMATVEEPAAPQVDSAFTSRLDQYVEVSIKGRNPVYIARAAETHPMLSDSDREALDHVATKYGTYSWSQLVTLTHQHVAWKNTPRPGEIDYRMFFLDEPGAQQGAQEYLELFQEERDAAEVLSG